MVLPERIRELGNRIARDFDPDKIILFGSYTCGSPTEDSDVDLLVLLDFEGKSFYKSLEILNRADPHFPVDLFAKTVEEPERRYAQGDQLIREAFDHGVVVYEREKRVCPDVV